MVHCGPNNSVIPSTKQQSSCAIRFTHYSKTSILKLKHLFWTELNYDRANQPLSTRNWDDNERALVSGDPLLLAEHGDFHIIYG